MCISKRGRIFTLTKGGNDAERVKKRKMTYLLDLENGIENSAFGWWIENFGLDAVAIDDNGEVVTFSSMDIPNLSELEAEAMSINSGSALTEEQEDFATEFHAACVRNGYNMEDVISNALPYIKGFIESRDRERKVICSIIKGNKASLIDGTFDAAVMAGDFDHEFTAQ